MLCKSSFGEVHLLRPNSLLEISSNPKSGHSICSGVNAGELDDLFLYLPSHTGQVHDAEGP
jgi:hypothetical protein